MDLITDLNGQTAGTAPTQVIGWWCLFDTDVMWEWGATFLTDLYKQEPLNTRFSTPPGFLQISANQAT